MILDDLNTYYLEKRNDPASSMPRQGWSVVRVGWEFRIDPEGKLVSILSLVDDSGKSPEMQVPEQVARTSGVKPFFLCDKAAYFFGLDEKRGEECFAKSAELHHKVLDGVQDEAAKAVLGFFDQPSQLACVEERVIEDLKGGSLIVFRYIPDSSLVHERSAVMDAWEGYLNQGESRGGEVQCSITGEWAVPSKLFPMVKGIPGSQSSGASLISFNQDAFCSYGRTKGDKARNASISEEASFNVGAALQYLSMSPTHHVDIGGTRVLYWTDSDSPESLGVLSLFMDPNAELSLAAEDESVLDRIRNSLHGLRSGKYVELDCDGPQYYVLGVSGSQGRLSVRFFEKGSLGVLQERARQYYEDIALVGRDGELLKPSSLRRYLLQAAVLGKAENLPNTLVCSTLRALFRGTAFPQALSEQLLARMRVDKGYLGSDRRDVLPLRIAMLKACVIRSARQKGMKSEERSLTVSLNEDNANIGYLLGRLFAILEKAQQDAVPGANSTIRDRFIGSASATPARVFPQLLKTAQHHISKAEYGASADRRLQEVVGRIDSGKGFPATLSYDDQGQFFIGYYQQKQALYMKKASRIATENEEE